MSGEVISGEVTSGEVMSGEVMSGEVISGEVMSGDVMSGEVMSGEVISGDVMSGDVISGAATSCGMEAVKRRTSSSVRPAASAAFISSAACRMSLKSASVTSKRGSSTSAVTCCPASIGTRYQRD